MCSADIAHTLVYLLIFCWRLLCLPSVVDLYSLAVTKFNVVMADVSAAPIRKPSLLRKDASVPLLHEQTGSVTHVDILPASKPISQSIQPVSKAIVPLSTLKLNAAYLGLVFAALFTAVNTVQALMTTLFPGIGMKKFCFEIANHIHIPDMCCYCHAQCS